MLSVLLGVVAQSAIAATDPKPSSPSVSDPWNSRLSVDVGSSGAFSMGAFPDPATGSPTTGSYKLLYGWPSTGTSFSTVRVDGVDSVLGVDVGTASGPTETAGTSSTVWSAGPVSVKQTISLATNPQTGQADAARIEYQVSNNDTASHSIGVRAMLDTDVNDNDGAPFRIPGIGAVTTEQDLSGAAVPDSFQVFQDLADSNHIAGATLTGGDATTPDRLVVAQWGGIRSTPWDYTTTAGAPITSDSAYAAYWNPTSVAPGASRTFVTYYGLANVTVDLTPPFALGVTGPASLSTANGAYSPNPFTVTATVSDSGTGPINDAFVSLNLPVGLTMAGADTRQVSLGTINPGDPERIVTWHVTAATQTSAVQLTYGVAATASNTPQKIVTRPITIPTLAQAPAESRPYLAMGDSFSAGEGVPIYETRSSFDGCHRSVSAYPKKLASAVTSLNLKFVACSGALIANLYLGQNGEAAQMDSLNAATKIVSLTIGGNDAGFPDLLKLCVSGGGKSDAACQKHGGAIVRNALRNFANGQSFCPASGITCIQIPPLHGVYEAIHAKAPNARIYVLNYPSMFKSDATTACSVGFGGSVTAANQVWMAQQAKTIDNAVKDQVLAAAINGVPVWLVDAAAPFVGHERCTAQAWFNGIVPVLTNNARQPVTGGVESFHPNAAGQASMFESLKAKLLVTGG